jgi:hypothetical protein
LPIASREGSLRRRAESKEEVHLVMCREVPAMPARLMTQKPLTMEPGRHRQPGRLRIQSMKASTCRIARNPANRQILQCGAGRITSLFALPWSEQSPCMHHRVVSNHIALAKLMSADFSAARTHFPVSRERERQNWNWSCLHQGIALSAIAAPAWVLVSNVSWPFTTQVYNTIQANQEKPELILSATLFNRVVLNSFGV